MELIFIEGNIGSGKSTFLLKLREQLNNNDIDFLVEDVNNWFYLNDFYKNPKEYSYELQNEILNSKYNQIKNSNKKIIYIERSFKTNLLFSLNSFFNGYINQKQLFNLFNLINKINNEINKKFTKINYIYIKTNFLTCLERIKKRNRECEKDIKIEYLKNLELLHDLFFNNSNNYDENLKIIKENNKNDYNLII